MSDKAPDVSIVMAVYNEELHIEDALRSIAGQAGVTVEILVIDDFSTDRTVELVKRLQGELPCVRFFNNDKKGKVSAFNIGVRESRGKWVAIFSGDDIMPGGSLAERVAVVEPHDRGGPVTGLSRIQVMGPGTAFDGQIIPRDPNKGNFTGVSYIWNRSALALFWPVPEHLPNEDTWLELVAQHFDVGLVHSGVVSCLWRVHDGNSINILLPWEEFNKRYTPRMAAARHMLDNFGASLAPESRRRLEARVDCEEARVRGDLFGILTARADWVTKLRAAAYCGKAMYTLRQWGTRLFSGF